MIDPVSSLAFSMQSNKGVYMMLLGSGISRSARIPTGWEITLELVRKVATLADEPCEPDPADWYFKRFGKDPDYSDLLDAVAKTPAERQQLLRGYWEPTAEERDEGAKLPTAAHRAIAELVKAGYIRVILTTNFDRLMESALQDVGVVPTVLSTVDHIEGAVPLIHTACTLIKIHGDYLDTRILNTPEELEDYPEPFKKLLDRLFDEFGLVICGWSADWDVALKSALTRAPYRRFSTYWASRGAPGESAMDLIARKSAQLIPVEGADTFFSRLKEQVFALEQYEQPHPMSTAAAVTALKKYLSEPKYRIPYADLVGQEVKRLLEITAGSAFGVQISTVDTATVTARVRAYDAAALTLVEMAIVAGHWSAADQIGAWEIAIKKLAFKSVTNGIVFWFQLKRYPAALLFYGLGLGAVANKNFGFIKRLFEIALSSEQRDEKPAVVQLAPSSLFDGNGQVMRRLEGMDRRHAPLNDWLQAYFEPLALPLFESKDGFEFGFDLFEILIALAVLEWERISNSGHAWAPPGCYGYRSGNRIKVLDGMKQAIAGQGVKSIWVSTGIFGDTEQVCLSNIEKLEAFVSQLGWWY